MDSRPSPARLALEALIEEQLTACTPAQYESFRRHRIPLRLAPLKQHDTSERVFLVAQRGSEVMYFEAQAQGFNFSFMDAQGEILHHWRESHTLSQALPHWMGFNHGRDRSRQARDGDVD